MRGRVYCLTLVRDGKPIYSLDYHRQVIDPPLELLQMFMAEEDHFDFCLVTTQAEVA